MGKHESTLKRKLNAFHLWGLTLRLVISGDYFVKILLAENKS
jgi:ethanolamine permease